MIEFRIGDLAVAIMMLDDDAVCETTNVKRVRSTRKTTTFRSTPAAASLLAEDMQDRGSAWDYEPGERAALKRAIRAIRKAVDEVEES